MARNSRHRSHRSLKHRDRSDSEEEEARVSRVSETEKRRSSSGNMDISAEGGKKRKERGEDSSASDRWNGGGEDIRVGNELNEEIEVVDVENSSMPKADGSDLKGKSSSGRWEGSSERNEEKRRSEKELSRRESSSSGQYKEGKEKEREKERERERMTGKDKRTEDGVSRKEERVTKKDLVISELQDKKHGPELERELDKHMKRRRDGSGDTDSLHGDGKESDARRISSKDDYSKNGSHKDERYKDGRYKEKYGDNLDRDQRQRDDKRRDEPTSRVHTSDRSESKYSRDDNRLSESHYKTKLRDCDRDGSTHVDDNRTELKDNRGKKRPSDENEDSGDMKPQNTKESREDTERNRSRSGRHNSDTDRAREHPHPDKVDSGLSNNRLKGSPGSSAYAIKDQTRHNSRQAESSRREHEETRRPRTASRGDHRVASGGCERVFESRSMEKTRLKDDTCSDVLLSEACATSQYDKTLRSDNCSSPNHLSGKSPTSTIDRQSDRIGVRRILNVEEMGQRSSNCKDGKNSSSSKDFSRDQELPVDKLKGNGSSQVDLLTGEPTTFGPSSYNRTAHSQSTSPGHLPPPPPVRLGVDSPSVLGLNENENRIHNADRRTSNRYKRSNDVSTGRGPATPWKSTPAWSSAANGFMPLQHGPPAGFHPAVQQFPAPPLFGVRPSMGSYNFHEPNSFSGHARSYGWHNPVDDCSPHLQLWDGSNNMFGDESHVYGRPDWDPNRHLMGNRAWEMSVDMWNGQHGNVNMEYPVPRKEQEYSVQTLADEAWSGQSEHRSQDERAVTVLPTADAGGINQSMDTSLALKAFETPPKALLENVSEPSNVTNVHETSEKQRNNFLHFCCNYLSKLEILPDLVQPELYEQCLSLMGTRDGIVAGNVGHHKNNESQDARVAAKNKKYLLNSRSPTSIDAVFQRAMSLYQNQKEAVNLGLGLASSKEASSKEEKVPSASDGTKVDADPPNNIKDDVPMVGSVSTFSMEVENKTTADAESDYPGDIEDKHDDPTNTKKKCGDISESVVLAEGSEDCEAEGSEDCEAIMPECRVNLSRIHLSLESTH